MEALYVNPVMSEGFENRIRLDSGAHGGQSDFRLRSFIINLRADYPRKNETSPVLRQSRRRLVAPRRT
jgi:hypothetical protein